MMKIAINANSFLKAQYTGIGRYAYNLVKSLESIDQQNDYTIYCQLKLFDKRRTIPKFTSTNFNVKADYFRRGLRLLKNIDVYHAPCPEVIQPLGSKVIVTIHDLVYQAFPEGHTEKTLRLTHEQFMSFIPHADHFICCSTNTKNDLKRFFDVNDSKITVIHPGIDRNEFFQLNEQQEMTARESIKELGITTPFLLSVGTLEPRKNLVNIFRAFSILKKKSKYTGKLVVAGMKGWKNDSIAQAIKSLNIQEDVVFLGFITNEMLRNLYHLTDVFIFPSFYEGFGYPIVEAFCCGAAVVTSNVSSCPEVAGDAAVLTDPNQSEKIAQAVSHLLEDSHAKNDFIRKALLRSADFDFKDVAKKTLQVYEKVISPSV